jgi:hypothetical protein
MRLWPKKNKVIWVFRMPNSWYRLRTRGLFDVRPVTDTEFTDCIFDFTSDIRILKALPFLRGYLSRELDLLLRFEKDRITSQHPTMSFYESCFLAKQEVSRKIREEVQIIKNEHLVLLQEEEQVMALKQSSAQIGRKTNLWPKSGDRFDAEEDWLKQLDQTDKAKQASILRFPSSPIGTSGGGWNFFIHLMSGVYQKILKLFRLGRKKEFLLEESLSAPKSANIAVMDLRRLQKKLIIFLSLRDPEHDTIHFPEKYI